MPINYNEIIQSPNYIASSEGILSATFDDEESEMDAGNYLRFDKVMFPSKEDFTKYITSIVFNSKYVSESLVENKFDIFTFSAPKGINFFIRVPSRSEVLSIDREYLILTTKKYKEMLLLNQPIRDFDQLKLEVNGL